MRRALHIQAIHRQNPRQQQAHPQAFFMRSTCCFRAPEGIGFVSRLTDSSGVDTCLASSKISAQKLHYSKIISSTKGQHLQGSTAVKLPPHSIPPIRIEGTRAWLFFCQLHAILESNTNRETKVDGTTAQEAGRRSYLLGSMFAA
jgi:hypothetical protein